MILIKTLRIFMMKQKYTILIKKACMTKNGVLPETNFFFLNILFQWRTSYKELIWCTNDTNVHIQTFCERWSFIWRCFSSVSLIEKYQTISINFKIHISQLIFKIKLKQRSFWDTLTSFFRSKILKYYSDCYNQNFSVLRLKWTQTMDMKQNQTFYYETYPNLVSYFLSKNNKVFQWLSKLKFLSFTTKVNPSNGNETKSGIFPSEIFKSTIFQWL